MNPRYDEVTSAAVRPELASAAGPAPSEYDYRGDAEKTAVVEDAAAEWADYVSEYAAEVAAEEGDTERPIVADAIKALSAWGVDLAPDSAATLLRSWRRADQLTPEQVAEVAARFSGADPGDRGPSPEVVELETGGWRTTIEVSPRVRVVVTEDIGRTGHTGLTVELGSGEHITVALPSRAVDAVAAALTAAGRAEVAR
ncbi:hypothetical protein JQS43_21885 [Natronosporangium hydrolyticum]|uniref:Uncharacterized protein n=1 Tax=Natronosporangium hydrolyticum TaxID=2811111 RepID=A0A895Y8U6_9ACTN|nr:hypothetical protein [Natronosporangium hydrolyticum]QSB14147.1 hypothetical protein JQS43_21885 [Natronosporangium hydrolyticum]